VAASSRGCSFVRGRQHRQARHAAQGLDDGQVRQSLDLVGADDVDDAGRLQLAVDRLEVSATDAGDDDRVDLGAWLRLCLPRHGRRGGGEQRAKRDAVNEMLLHGPTPVFLRAIGAVGKRIRVDRRHIYLFLWK
jgi:hypothetical protein